jgi:general stress protein 26
MQQENLNKSQSLEKLTELVNKVKVCMFATVNEDYSVQSRPMQTIQVDSEGAIWFFTNEYSEKVDDISKDNTIYLMYAHPGQNTYLHVTGRCSIVNDRQKMEELWSPIVKAWFPKGLEDPALSLLKVEANEASYWDGTSNKFVVFYNIVKAIAKGEQSDQGEFGHLKMA